ncbi:elongin-B [Haliaeetus albicilla]|nr:PREDICTED: transcription elongation factor B polypeptide 2 [Haliaeetus albicilla]XP_010561828.1 PREDICTED: transcription elongation factor B polypeptide 2 [Haliaeetus leucocephalus]
MIDVHVMVHHHRTTIFTEAKETTTVHELKKVVEGILKRPLEEQQLYKDDQLLDDDHRTLLDCGLSSRNCHPHVPAMVSLALFRPGNGTFEPLCIDPLSSTPELPDVKKSQLCGSSSREQTLC